jgi:hypothetical protein
MGTEHTAHNAYQTRFDRNVAKAVRSAARTVHDACLVKPAWQRSADLACVARVVLELGRDPRDGRPADQRRRR